MATFLEFQPTLNTFLALGAIVFTIYHYFRNPQIKSDKIDALMKQHLEFLTLQFNEKFKNFDSQLANLRDNHIHTLDTKLDTTRDSLNNLSREVTRLATIIEERIPRK